MALNTQEALTIVGKYKTGIQSEIADKQKIVDGFQVLEDYLNGILDTPAQDLLEEKAKVATLTEEKEALELAKQKAESEKLALEAQIEAKGETPVTKE